MARLRSVAEPGGGHEPDSQRNAGAGQERDRPEHDETAHPLGVVQGVPERPDPASRGTGQHRRLEPELVEDLVDELDRAVAKGVPRELVGVAEPVAWSIDEEGPHPLWAGAA